MTWWFQSVVSPGNLTQCLGFSLLVKILVFVCWFGWSSRCRMSWNTAVYVACFFLWLLAVQLPSISFRILTVLWVSLWRFFSHCGLCWLPGDFFVACRFCGFGPCLVCCEVVVRGRFCALWFFRAIATTSSCPMVWVLMMLDGCGGPDCWRGSDLDCTALAWSCLAFSAFSSKQNFLIFSWFRLYSPTALHATICISLGLGSGSLSRGFVSVTMAKSFLLITVFFRLSVSSVIVWGE